MFIIFVDKKLNRTLAIDSPFQTFAVGLLVEFYRLALPLLSPEMLSSLSKLRIFLLNAHLALFVRRMTSSLSKLTLELALELVRALYPSLLADQTTSRIMNWGRM